jgi:hypothetical protein
VSNEKDVIKQIEKTLESITKNATTTADQNYTLGMVTQDRDNGTFGTFYQQTTNRNTLGSYNGLDILYAMIYSEFYSEFGSVKEIYKLFVALLYNRAKYWSQRERTNVNPANVVKYMVDMALNLQANYGGYELRKYFDEKNANNQASLQKLIEKYKLDPENEICVLLNNIAKCTNTAQVNELLIPTNLQQQKLKILTSEGKNFTSEGKPVFTTQNKLYPKINFNDIDLEKNYSKSWQAYNVIYTNNILTEETPDLANSTIYDINVNDENRKEYEFLNVFATDTITAGYSNSEFTYLGCFDRNKGITFVGRLFNDKQVDNYLSTVASGTKLLPGKANQNILESKYPDLPLVPFSPTTLPIKDLVNYLKGLPIDTNVKIATVAKAINEQGGKRTSNGYQLTGFNNNYYGVQTDGAYWKTGSEYIVGRTRQNENQTGNNREFAVFKTWQDGGQFMVSTVQRLGLYVGGTPNRQVTNPYYKKKVTDALGWANTYYFEWVANGQPFTNEIKNNLILIYNEAKNLFG